MIVSNLASFYEHYCEKRDQELLTRFPTTRLLDCQICLEVFSLVVHHLTIFDDLIQKEFYVIPKITVGNLRKPFHDHIIILISTSSLKLKTLGMKEKNYKNLNNILKTKRAILVNK